MAIERYHGQPLPIIVKFDEDPLLVYNKSVADITDISMTLKKDLDSDADDAYLEKKMSVSSGVSLDSSDPENIRFIMNIGENDYTNLTAGDCYLLTLAAEVSGFTNLIEFKIGDEEREVRITEDTSRA